VGQGRQALPVDTGGKIRSFNILRRLSKGHELTLISYYGGRRDPDYEAALPKQFPQSHIVYTAATNSDGFRGVLAYLCRLPRLALFGLQVHASGSSQGGCAPAFRRAVRRSDLRLPGRLLELSGEVADTLRAFFSTMWRAHCRSAWRRPNRNRSGNCLTPSSPRECRVTNACPVPSHHRRFRKRPPTDAGGGSRVRDHGWSHPA
jgi:hypothetical protein